MNSLRRKHKRRTCFFTRTVLDVSNVEDFEDYLNELVCKNRNLFAASHNGDEPDVVDALSKGPLRNLDYVPHSCEHYRKNNVA